MSSQSSFGDSDKENSTPNAVRYFTGDAKGKKRVLFSPHPELLQPSLDSRPDTLKIPRKSVLKPYSSSPTSSPLSERADPSTSTLLYMIESAIQSLAGNDRANKVETYTTLSNLFRAFDNVPDRAQLFPRLSELFTLILADVMRPSEEDPNMPDYPLNSKALKLAGFMLFDDEISQAVPIKSSRALMEHTLKRMEVPSVSKATSTQFLWLWQTQHLPKAVISTEIAERMLIATMKANFPSLIINQERMAVILRLLEQSRECMIRHVDQWLPRVISYMLDDNKLIRTAALRTALVAGRHLCKEASVGRCVQNYLKSDVEGVPFIEVTSERFKNLMQEPEGGIYVAHAWGSICTLSSSQNPEKSKTLMAWMHVLQIVFNSPATENKVMAQSAWVRMIHYFCNNGDIVYREKNLAYLTKPMSRMLSRDIKVYDTVRMAAVNTLCSLLYALLRPGLNHEQVSLVWNEVVKSTLGLMLESHQKVVLQQRAVDILIAILETKPVDAWSLDRLLDSKVGSESEVANLESRWVRQNISAVMPVVLAALRSAASEETKYRLWTAIQKCLKSAGAKEVQISADAMKATAVICRVFQDLWNAPIPVPGSPSNVPAEDVSHRTTFVANLILSTFDNWSPSSFTEKSLPQLEEIVTPTSDADTTSTREETFGLAFIYELFQNPIDPVVVASDYIDLLEALTVRATSPIKSVRKCLILLSQCLSHIPQEKKKIPVQSWKILAETASNHLQAEMSRTVAQSPSMSLPTSSSADWSIVSKLLAFGANVQHGAAFREWINLAQTFVAANAKSHGDKCMNEIAEILAQALLAANCLQESYLSIVLRTINFKSSPPASRTLLPNRSQLPELGTKSEISTTCTLLAKALSHYQSIWRKYKLTPEFVSFLNDVATFLCQVPSREAAIVLETMQGCAIPWLERADEGATNFLEATIKLFRTIPVHDSESLAKLEDLWVHFFSCSNSALVQTTKDTWNETFGSTKRLEYPTRLFESIQAMDNSIGELSLPTWPAQDPEVEDNSDKSKSTTAIAPPKMSSLTKSIGSSPSTGRPRSRAGSAGRSAASEGVVKKETSQGEFTKSSSKESRKRKRESHTSAISTRSPRPDSPTVSEPSSAKTKVASRQSTPTSTPRRKRQRRTRTSEAGSPLHVVDSAERLPMVGDLSDTVDVSTAESVFTLRKRELRCASPQIHSDPISESSPSVYTRIRRRSSSQDRTAMDEMRQSVRSLSPTRQAGPVIHEDLEIPEGPPDIVVAEDELASPSRPDRNSKVNSDDLMQLQILDEKAIDFDVGEREQETIDEDLFILQLQQYRKSLNEGRPITPRRRHKLGLLMKEIAGLSGDVTEAYFDRS